MKLPSLSIQSLTFSDQKTYEFAHDEKVILVGPNNSGKSLALREIKQIVSTNIGQDPFSLSKCIRNLELRRDGDIADVKNYILNTGTRDLAHTFGPIYFVGPYRVNADSSQFFMTKTLGELSNLYFKHISTENRLIASNPSGSIPAGGMKETAQQILYDDDTLFKKVSNNFRAAFGEELYIDYRGGSVIPIHIGQGLETLNGEDRVSNTYVARLRSFPRLDQQGDGMRGFAGILFEATVTVHDVTLLDEPEAFLHPPQMRRLAQTLAQDNTGQMFVSTHSSDILRGFLDYGSKSTRIIRIQRDGNINKTTETSTDVLRELWNNPDLKYSNALDGIFHELCILCEDDSDCRFYNAVADHVVSGDQDRWPDTIYVPCGGKHSIPKLAAALHTLGVPVRIAVDLDALSDEDTIRKLVEALGASWAPLSKFWTIVNSAVTKGVKPKSVEEIKRSIAEIMSSSEGLPKGRIAEAMKADSSWNIIKNAGKSAIPKGDAYAAFEALDANLRQVGIFVVPAGQAEGFLPSVGKHGPAFVTAALALDIDSDAFSEVRKYVKSLAGPA